MAYGQSNAFEVATVKPNKSGGGATLIPGLRNGTLSARNVTLKALIRTAYGVSDRQIVGPSWLDADHFDLAGKAPKGVSDAQLMPLLQTLLKDRFQLTIHRETRVMPAFDMIVAKGGPKITPFDPARPVTPPKGYSGPMNFGVVTEVPPLENAGHDWFVLRRLTRHLAGRMDSPQALLSGDGRARRALPLLTHVTCSENAIGYRSAPGIAFWRKRLDSSLGQNRGCPLGGF